MIKNKITLYSILRYHLSEEFDFGKGNTLDIFFTEVKKNREQLVLDIIEVKNGICSKKRFLRDFNGKSLSWKIL